MGNLDCVSKVLQMYVHKCEMMTLSKDLCTSAVYNYDQSTTDIRHVWRIGYMFMAMVERIYWLVVLWYAETKVEISKVSF